MSTTSLGGFHLKRFYLLLLTLLVAQSLSFAQTAADETGEAKIIQPTQSSTATTPMPAPPMGSELRVPAGTLLEIEVAYTVDSLDLKAGDRISFRVLVPIVIDGVTVIERDALVTARVTQSKRGGHWGKAGKLAWSMEDVVAADSTRILLAPETATRNDKLWSLANKPKNSETAMGQGRVTGASHGGEVAAHAIVSGVLFPPLALMHGFKRGENAILREGRRYVVAVGKETTVKVLAVVSPE